jgi:hypothetical protein
VRRCSHSPRSPRPAEEGEAAEDWAPPPATKVLIESALPLPARQPSPRRSKVTARPEGRSALRQAPMRTRSAAENQNRRCSLLPSLPQPARGGRQRDERGHRRPDLIRGVGLEDARRRGPTASSRTSRRSVSAHSSSPLTACRQAPAEGQQLTTYN